ncbi:unnamed protein product, partial [Schistosoma turkestanicum]
HLVPDRYTKHSLLSCNSNQQPIIEKPICPYCCSSCDLIKNSLDQSCLNDTLFIVSCLFSAAFISYPEAIQRRAIINSNCQQNKKKTFTSSSSLSSSTVTSMDTFILQSACEQSRIQLKIYLNTILLGPVKLSSKTSSTSPSSSSSSGMENISDNDTLDILTKYTNWFNVLNLAACCLQRVFLQSTHHTHHQQQQQQQQQRKSNLSTMMTTMMTMKQRGNKFECFNDLKLYMNKLKITNDWWSVLMNMFVCSLRGMWLDCVSNNNQ